MIGIQGITGLSGIQGTTGIIGAVGISGQESGGAGPLPTIYANYPLFNNPNSTVGGSVITRQGLSLKNVSLTDGIESIPTTQAAVFPNHLLADGSSSNGLLVEKQQTSGISRTNDVTASGWVKTGGGSAINGDNDEIELDFGFPNTSFRLYQDEPAYIGNVCAQVLVKAFPGESGDYVLSLQESGNVITGNAVTIDDSKWYLAYAAGSFNGSSGVSVYFGRGDRGQTAGRVKIKYPQYVTGTLYTSSFIDNPSAASATRGADKYTLPTTTAARDEGWFCGNRSDLGFINGINPTTNAYTHNGSGENPVLGKYAGIWPLTDGVGSIITSGTGKQIRVTGASNGILFERVGVITDQELIDEFGYPNLCDINFSTSLLTQNGVLQLRDRAGDGTEFVTFPSTDIEFNLDAIPLQDEGATILNIDSDDSSYFTRLSYDETSGLIFQHGTDTITAPQAIAYGQEFSISAAISASELLLNGQVLTRTDSRNNAFAISGNLDGGNTLITSLQVKEYQSPPVQPSQLIVEQYQEPNDIGDGGYLKTSPAPVISQTPASVLFGSNQESSSITPDFLIDGVKIQAIGWTGAGAYIEFDGDLDRFQFIEMNVNGISYLFENDGETGGNSEFARFGAASLISVFEAARDASQPVTVALNPVNGSGSLNPLLSIDGNEIISLNYFAAGEVVLKIDGVNLGIPAITLSLNGADYTLQFDGDSQSLGFTKYTIESAPLAGILSTAAASGTPIDFTAQIAP